MVFDGALSRKVEILSKSGSRLELETDVGGSGCIHLAAGAYTAAVKLTPAADEAGMR